MDSACYFLWIDELRYAGLLTFRTMVSIYNTVPQLGITIGCSAAIGYVVDAQRHSADSALGGIIAYVQLVARLLETQLNHSIQF